MLPRFYAPDLDARLGRATLSVDEARHLTRVLRLGVGDEVAVFDGRGTEFRAVVESALRDAVTLRFLDRQTAPSSLAVEIVVVQAVLKGKSMDDAVRDATMMGAVAVEPVFSAHSDVKTALARKPETVDRWRRVALAAVKQCRRATLPAIEPPRSFEEWLATSIRSTTLIFVEPSAPCEVRSLKSLLSEPVSPSAAVVLGPEGGWAVEEVEAAVSRGCIPVTLGPLTLRAESMPVAALAALAAIWQA